jgi:hypothetical protein
VSAYVGSAFGLKQCYSGEVTQARDQTVKGANDDYDGVVWFESQVECALPVCRRNGAASVRAGGRGRGLGLCALTGQEWKPYKPPPAPTAAPAAPAPPPRWRLWLTGHAGSPAPAFVIGAGRASVQPPNHRGNRRVLVKPRPVYGEAERRLRQVRSFCKRHRIHAVSDRRAPRIPESPSTLADCR